MGTRSAAIYCRISQDRVGAGLGVERQLADCRALARRLGWRIVAEHTDNDLSASNGKPRPGYRALLADLDAGHANAVIVWHTDRLHRSPRELEEYVDLAERRKITTQTVKAGEIDLATPSGRAVARTLGAWARFEVEHKSDRTKRAQAQAAAAGRWLGGAPPLGWHVREDGSATLDRPAARRIARGCDDLLAGVTLGELVRQWNAAGFRSGTGRPWTYTTCKQVLTRARNAGLVELNGEVAGRSTWPAIVTEDTLRSVRALLADPSRRKSESNVAKYLLAGIAVCGAAGCGAPLRSATASGPGSKRMVYRCRTGRGGGHVARAIEPLDALVSRVIEARLARRDLDDLAALAPGASSADVLADARAEANAVRAQLDEVADAYADGTLTKAQLARINERLRARLGAAEAVLASATRGSVLSGVIDARDPVAAWRAAPTTRRRAIVRALLAVTVLPIPAGQSARGIYDPETGTWELDPDLIGIEWRTGDE